MSVDRANNAIPCTFSDLMLLCIITILQQNDTGISICLFHVIIYVLLVTWKKDLFLV